MYCRAALAMTTSGDESKTNARFAPENFFLSLLLLRPQMNQILIVASYSVELFHFVPPIFLLKIIPHALLRAVHLCRLGRQEFLDVV